MTYQLSSEIKKREGWTFPSPGASLLTFLYAVNESVKEVTSLLSLQTPFIKAGKLVKKLHQGFRFVFPLDTLWKRNALSNCFPLSLILFSVPPTKYISWDRLEWWFLEPAAFLHHNPFRFYFSDSSRASTEIGTLQLFCKSPFTSHQQFFSVLASSHGQLDTHVRR